VPGRVAVDRLVPDPQGRSLALAHEPAGSC